RGIDWVHVAPLARSDFPVETLAELARGRRLSLDGQGLVRPAEIGPLRLDGGYDPALLRAVTVLKLAEEEALLLADGLDEGSRGGSGDRARREGRRRRLCRPGGRDGARGGCGSRARASARAFAWRAARAGRRRIGVDESLPGGHDAAARRLARCRADLAGVRS